MKFSLPNRVRQEEWMDRPDVDPAELDYSLAYIRKINSRLGYTRSTIAHLEEFSRGWRRDRTITLLDVATGSADIPLAILRWADRRGWKINIVGVDRHERTASSARRLCGVPRFSIVRGDAMLLPFADASFDYVLTAMFLHHLDDADVVRAIAEMNRVARRGIVVADLLRDRRAYAWICLFTMFSRPMIRHDARVSVMQAFTKREITSLRDRAGASYATFHTHFGHRFVLAGEK